MGIFCGLRLLLLCLISKYIYIYIYIYIIHFDILSGKSFIYITVASQVPDSRMTAPKHVMLSYRIWTKSWWKHNRIQQNIVYVLVYKMYNDSRNICTHKNIFNRSKIIDDLFFYMYHSINTQLLENALNLSIFTDRHVAAKWLCAKHYILNISAYLEYTSFAMTTPLNDFSPGTYNQQNLGLT